MNCQINHDNLSQLGWIPGMNKLTLRDSFKDHQPWFRFDFLSALILLLLCCHLLDPVDAIIKRKVSRHVRTQKTTRGGEHTWWQHDIIFCCQISQCSASVEMLTHSFFFLNRMRFYAKLWEGRVELGGRKMTEYVLNFKKIFKNLMKIFFPQFSRRTFKWTA